MRRECGGRSQLQAGIEPAVFWVREGGRFVVDGPFPSIQFLPGRFFFLIPDGFALPVPLWTGFGQRRGKHGLESWLGWMPRVGGVEANGIVVIPGYVPGGGSM